MMRLVEVEFFMKDAETYYLADSKLYIDDAIRN
jgi:hypothetical protein